MRKMYYLKSFIILFVVVFLVSCDSDSNEIGADVIGNDNFETGTPEYFSVSATNQELGPVETLDLAASTNPINALGIYNNPVFGVTKANLAVQLQLNPVNPNFNPLLAPKIESVVLTIPYFSERTSTNPDGSSTYKLDSIYGPTITPSKIKLRIYESNYYIRDIDPQTQDIQRYYSNQNQDFDNAKGLQLNDTSDVRQNEEFIFSAAELVEPGEVTTETPNPQPIRSAPGLKIYLNKAFFKSKLIDADQTKLLNNNVFKEYFRGLYFKVESSGSDEGNLAMLNVKAGKITIKYKQYKTVPTADVPTPEKETKKLEINLNGKSVGLIESDPVPATNSERLYLKGGAGYMSVIDLFGPGQLEELRTKNWLVNDASLTFYIDNNATNGMGKTNSSGGNAREPNRIYLYDLKNKRPLVDYYSDQNSPSSDPKFSKSNFGGIIKKTSGRGTYYKIRITNHIRELIKNTDSTNVQLGLVVTESINEVGNKKLRATTTNNNISVIPTASILNPLGTILYGSNIPSGDPDYEKRIQLKIYFTKPKQN